MKQEQQEIAQNFKINDPEQQQLREDDDDGKFALVLPGMIGTYILIWLLLA